MTRVYGNEVTMLHTIARVFIYVFMGVTDQLMGGPTPCGYFDWKLMIEQFIWGGPFWPHVVGPKLRITVIRVVHEGLTGQGLTSHYMAVHDPVFGV